VRISTLGFALVALVTALPAPAQLTTGERWLTLRLQRSWPDQGRTNELIALINQEFGTDFEDWNDQNVAQLGLSALWRTSRRIRVGIDVDYSRGALENSSQVPVEGGGTVQFELDHKYTALFEVMAVAQFTPWPAMDPAQPFFFAGAGLGYAKDRLTLRLGSQEELARATVHQDGAFPLFAIGAGVDLSLFRSPDWYLQAGAAYAWGSLETSAPIEGELAAGGTAVVATDVQGPRVWLGVGSRF
jgi:hypothetical protein